MSSPKFCINHYYTDRVWKRTKWNCHWILENDVKIVSEMGLWFINFLPQSPTHLMLRSSSLLLIRLNFSARIRQFGLLTEIFCYQALLEETLEMKILPNLGQVSQGVSLGAFWGQRTSGSMQSIQAVRPGQNGRHFADIFRCKILYCDEIFIGFVPKSRIYNKSCLSLGNGLAPDKQQAITWTNVDLVDWQICLTRAQYVN